MTSFTDLRAPYRIGLLCLLGWGGMPLTVHPVEDALRGPPSVSEQNARDLSAEHATQPVSPVPPEPLWFSPTGQPLQISNPYRPPPHPYAAGHRGIDLEVDAGSQVIAPTTAVVTFSGTVAGRGVLTLRVDDRTLLTLEPIVTALAADEQVHAGQLMGHVASGGHCSASCLHLGVRVEGNYTHPLSYFLERPELVAWGTNVSVMRAGGLVGSFG